MQGRRGERQTNDVTIASCHVKLCDHICDAMLFENLGKVSLSKSCACECDVQAAAVCCCAGGGCVVMCARRAGKDWACCERRCLSCRLICEGGSRD